MKEAEHGSGARLYSEERSDAESAAAASNPTGLSSLLRLVFDTAALRPIAVCVIRF